MNEKLLPQNIEAEECLLGSLIIDPEALSQVEDMVRPDDFYRDAHRTLYAAMLTLAARREPCDLVMLCNELQRASTLADVGGASAILSLTHTVPTSANVVSYARIVAQKALYRRLIHAAGQMAALAYDECENALEEAERLLFALGETQAAEITPLVSVLSDCLDTLDALHERRTTISGIPTGYRHLDAPLGGLQRSDLVILAARPGTGKTSFAVNAARHACQVGYRVLLFSLEMSRQQLGMRLLSMEAGIDQHRLRLGRVEDDEWEQVVAAMGTLSELPFWMDDTAALPLASLCSRARRMQAQEGIDLIIVDYLQLMRVIGEGKRVQNREQEIAEISRGLKALAKELKVPVLALAQLSRAVETRASKVPQLSDLRECVVGSTRLIDAKTGKWKPITAIQPKDEVLGVGERQKVGRFAVENVWSTGKKPVYRLTTRTGRQMTATANHPLLTASGWKPLGQLQRGECIATALRLPEHGKELPERADLCRFLGYMVGDGTYQNHRAVGFISSDPETFEDALAIVKTHFPTITPRPHICRGKAQEVYFSSIHANGYGKPYGNPLREWIRSLDIFGQRDATKHVPLWVFEAGRIGACEFLAGYISSDGCVKRTMPTKWEIHFDTVSRHLAYDVQALLLRIGVVAGVNEGVLSSKGTQPIYRITVSAVASNLRRFAEQVFPRGKKGRLLQEMLTCLPQKHTRPGVFTLPLELSAYLAHYASDQFVKVTAWQWAHGKRQISRDTAAYWALTLADSTLAEWAESDLLWEPIRSIEPAGEEEVFDICVPGCANFVADGIIAHNSGAIENDADVVLFIYRDELYTPESEAAGTADLIIAKHRNGPTGTIRLGFDPTQTRFYTLDQARGGDL